MAGIFLLHELAFPDEAECYGLEHVRQYFREKIHWEDFLQLLQTKVREDAGSPFGLEREVSLFLEEHIEELLKLFK